MIQNVDIFTPIVDDPETQGKIAACNITNDVYATGCLDINSMLCFLAAPVELPQWVLSGMLDGFQAFLKDLGTRVTGGHTIINPWVLIGGTATGFVDSKYLVTNQGVQDGDSLILTKPLGTQPVMALSRMMKKPEFMVTALEILPESDMHRIIEQAITIMTTSNKVVTEITRNLSDQAKQGFKVHAMTDVTGFGLAGHAENLARASKVDIEITRVPHIKWALELSNLMGYDMDNARSAETAGGMMISIGQDHKKLLVKSLEDAGIDHFEVGRARSGSGNVSLSSKVEFLPT